MKPCIDCKYVKERDRESFEKCAAPKNIKRVDPVNGKKVVGWIYCETHRENGWVLSLMFSQCGRAGRWLEPSSPAQGNKERNNDE